jgi:hypothetical protein
MNAMVFDPTPGSPPYIHVASVTGVVTFYNHAKRRSCCLKGGRQGAFGVPVGWRSHD